MVVTSSLSLDNASGADAGLAGHRPSDSAAGAFGLEDAAGGLDQRARQVAMVVRPGLGASSFSHWLTVNLYPNAVKMMLTPFR